MDIVGVRSNSTIRTTYEKRWRKKELKSQLGINRLEK